MNSKKKKVKIEKMQVKKFRELKKIQRKNLVKMFRIFPEETEKIK